ncbi:solute carrier family 22 member 5 [Hippoglossus stenolepis]|uniref:solute carrier family 22 member 5 n=1 Tax=Hippoglossus stenolepis TaxID=195615 RepID=UPI001FAED50F|nr:solute carrier family 22 member 5 [Hippoglossus stenolepis]
MPNPKMSDYDETTSFLGNYGSFQILIIVLLGLSGLPCGYMGVIVVFVSDTPEHHCKVWSNSTIDGAHVEPPFHERSSWIGPDSCSRYKVRANWTGPVELGNDTEECVDGWVYSTERYTATIVSEWELVCDNAWKVPFSTSLYFVGGLFGSFISGHFSDRFGRKPVFFFTLVFIPVTALIQATSVSWVMFCIFNCLKGVVTISNYLTSLVLGAEMLSESARVSYTFLGHSLGFGLGYALLPLFAYFIRGWRMLLVASAIPGLLIVPTWWLIPESPRWLLQKGRVEEAELVIRNAAKMNRVPVPEVLFKAGECSELQPQDEAQQTFTYMDLIRTRNMRNITILGVFIWMSVAMVFYGLALNTSNLNGNIYVNCFISAAIDIGMYLATWLLVNRAPRPIFLFSSMMFCGIMLLIIKLVPEDMHLMFQVLGLLGRMGVSAAYSFMFMFFTELIPTVVRNMGLGVNSTGARIGNIISPYVIYLGVYSKILPYLIFGTFSIMAAVFSILLPNTRNSKLPDLISQTQPIRSCHCCCPKETATAQEHTTEGCKKMDKSATC